MWFILHRKTCVIWKYALPSSVIHYHCNHHRHTSSSPLSPAFFVITVIFRYVFGGFGMVLVSEDLSSMIVWTILYYTRYVGKLSTRSLSYLWPDLPLLLENNTTVVVSGCRPLARGLRSNVIKLRYVSIQTRLHIHTHLHSSEHRRVLCGRIHQRFQPDTLSLVP